MRPRADRLDHRQLIGRRLRQWIAIEREVRLLVKRIGTAQIGDRARTENEFTISATPRAQIHRFADANIDNLDVRRAASVAAVVGRGIDIRAQIAAAATDRGYRSALLWRNRRVPQSRNKRVGCALFL